MANLGTLKAISFKSAAFLNRYLAAVSKPGAIAPPIKALFSITS